MRPGRRAAARCLAHAALSGLLALTAARAQAGDLVPAPLDRNQPVQGQAPDLLAEVRAALAGHPGAQRVHLELNKKPPPFALTVQDGASVAVYPAKSEATAELRLLVDPPCHAMSEAMEQVNALERAVSLAAMTGVQRAVEVALRRREERAFVRDNREALALIAATRAEELRLESQRRELDAALLELAALRQDLLAQGPSLSQLAAELASEIEELELERAQVQGELDALSSEPSYLEALAVEAEHERLLAALADAQDALGRHDGGLDDILAAQNEAKSAFNTLARVTVATGEAAFPVLDGTYFDLLWTHPEPAGVPLVPGTIADVRWEIPGGISTVIPPFTYRLYERVGAALLPLEEVVPASPTPEPGSTTVEIVEDPTQVKDVEWTVAQGSDGQVFSRWVKQLVAPRPRARVSLGLGTYCGHVESVPETRHLALRDGWLAEVTQTHFRFSRRDSVEVFPQTLLGSYRAPAWGPELYARCSVDVDAFKRAAVFSLGELRDVLSRLEPTRWDGPLASRLSAMGFRCELPRSHGHGEAGAPEAGSAVSGAALWGTLARLLGAAGQQLFRPPSSSASAEGAPPPGLSALASDAARVALTVPAGDLPEAADCKESPRACLQALLAPPAPSCTKGELDCLGEEGPISYEARLGSIYWKPYRLESRVSFRVRGEVP